MLTGVKIIEPQEQLTCSYCGMPIDAGYLCKACQFIDSKEADPEEDDE